MTFEVTYVSGTSLFKYKPNRSKKNGYQKPPKHIKRKLNIILKYLA